MNKTMGLLLAGVLALLAIALWLSPAGADSAVVADLDAGATPEPEGNTRPAPGPAPGPASAPASRRRQEPTPKPPPAVPAARSDQITGVVLDAERGLPVAAARVTLRFPAADADEAMASAQADDSGQFVFSGLDRRQSWLVRAEHQGLLPDEEQGHAGQSLQLSLSRGGALYGTVTGADQQPAAGVRLSLRLMEQRRGVPLLKTATATTDARGEYRLAPIPRGPGTELWLAPPGGQLPELRDVVDEPGERRLDITLAEVFPLRCRVLDARTRAPVAGAVVRYEIQEPVARSGPDGELTLHVPLSTMRQLHVGADGFAPIEHDLKLERADLDRPLVLHLPRGGRLSGRVVDTAGAAVAGARVELTPQPLPPGQEADRQRAARTAMPQLAPASGFRGMPWTSTEVTDARGRFAFEGVAGRNGVFHGRLTVRRQGFCDAVREPIDMDLPAQDRVVEVTLSRGGMIEGVVRHDGKPVSAEVTFRHGTTILGVATNADGEFLLGPVPACQARLTARAGGYLEYWNGSSRALVGAVPVFHGLLPGRASQDVHVTEGARLQVTLDIASEPAPSTAPTATIRGRVVDTQDRGVPGIPIRFERDDSGGALAPAPTDAWGQFSVEVPTAEGRATYTIAAVADGSSKPHARVRPPHDGLVFQVSGKGRVTLEVACADGGTASSVNVFTRPATGGPWMPYQKDLADRGSTTVLDATEILSLPGGEVDLRVDVLGYVPVEVRAVRVTRAGETLRVVVHRGHTLLLMPTGEAEALERREVVLVGVDTPLPEGPLAAGVFRRLRHEAGQLQARTLGPGRYRLVSTDRELVFDPEVVEVKDQDVAGQVRVTRRR